jgi:hypothetical protein
MQQSRSDRVIILALSLTAAVLSSWMAGFFYTPLIIIYAGEWRELIPTLVLIGCFALATVAALYTRSETSPFTAAWKVFIVTGILVALAFGWARSLRIETSQFFAPIGASVEREIWRQIGGIALGFAALGAVAASVIRLAPFRPK